MMMRTAWILLHVPLASALIAQPRTALPSRNAVDEWGSRAVTMGLFDFLPGFQKETPPDGFVRASHVLFLAEEYADTKASQLLKRLQGGELTFGDAARGFSCCPTRDVNGDLGTFSSLGRIGELATLSKLPYEGSDTNEFDQVVFSPATPLGTPIKVNSQWGVHLVLIEARGAPTDDAGPPGPAPPSPPVSTAGGAW